MTRLVILKITIIFALNSLAPQVCDAQPGRYISTDDARVDFSALIRGLAETHPDPYTPFGGKDDFEYACFLASSRIPRDSLEYNEFQVFLREFVAGFRDGDTDVMGMDNPSYGFPYRVEFEVAPFGLILKKVDDEITDDSYRKVVGIDGFSTQEWAQRVGLMYPVENIYASYARLAWLLPQGWNGHGYDYSRQGSMWLELADEGGGSYPLEIKPSVSEKERDMRVPEPNPRYSFLSDSVTVFRARTMFGAEMYSAHEEVPSYHLNFTGEFADMLAEMKERGMPCLVVDLRGNLGGYTQICLPSLYMLYGDQVLPAIWNMKYLRKVSRFLLDRLKMTLDEYNEIHGSNFRIGDFHSMYEYPDFTGDVNTARNYFLDNLIFKGARSYLAGDGVPVYTPREVYVLTDAVTFSAAFHYAYFLWYCGATVVGTPPSQSPNCFMEFTPLVLPRSGITLSVSNSLQEIFEKDDPMSRVFTPSLMPGADDYLKYRGSEDPVMEWLRGEIISHGKVAD